MSSRGKKTESTTRRSERSPTDRTFALNNKYIEDLEDIHGGDVDRMLMSVINAQIAVLSSIYKGDAEAVAGRYIGMANGVCEKLRNGDVELAKGPRH